MRGAQQNLVRLWVMDDEADLGWERLLPELLALAWKQLLREGSGSRYEILPPRFVVTRSFESPQAFLQALAESTAGDLPEVALLDLRYVDPGGAVDTSAGLKCAQALLERTDHLGAYPDPACLVCTLYDSNFEADTTLLARRAIPTIDKRMLVGLLSQKRWEESGESAPAVVCRHLAAIVRQGVYRSHLRGISPLSPQSHRLLRLLAHELEPPLANIAFATNEIRRERERTEIWLQSIEDQLASVDSFADLFLRQKLRHPDNYVGQADFASEITQAIQRACRHTALVSAKRYLRKHFGNLPDLEALLDDRHALAVLFQSAFDVIGVQDSDKGSLFNCSWPFVRGAMHVLFRNALVHGLSLHPDVRGRQFAAAYIRISRGPVEGLPAEIPALSVSNECRMEDADKARYILEHPFPTDGEVLTRIHGHGLCAAMTYQLTQWALFAECTEDLESILEQRRIYVNAQGVAWVCRLWFRQHLAMVSKIAETSPGLSRITFTLCLPQLSRRDGKGGNA